MDLLRAGAFIGTGAWVITSTVMIAPLMAENGSNPAIYMIVGGMAGAGLAFCGLYSLIERSLKHAK